MKAIVLFLAVALLVLSGLMAYQLRQVRQISEGNRQAVESFCNTRTAIDAALVVPLLIETKLAIKAVPVGVARSQLIRIRQNLSIAHQELSSTSTCEEVR